MVRPPRNGPIIRQRSPPRLGADCCAEMREGKRKNKDTTSTNRGLALNFEWSIRKEIVPAIGVFGVIALVVGGQRRLTEARDRIIYMSHIYMTARDENREWKKGSTELLILSLIESRPRHGYEICKLIEDRSEGELRFHAASLYPLLYRLERRGWISGRWVEKTEQRRRRYYRLTRRGRRILGVQLRAWREFVAGINRITEAENA